MTYALLIIISVFIAVSGLIMARGAIDAARGNINLLKWHIAFVSVYLGAGGLFALLFMSSASYDWALDFYSITNQGVLLAGAAWCLLLAAVLFANRLFPSVIEVSQGIQVAYEDKPQAMAIGTIAAVITAIFVYGYFTGSIGYMGILVGDETSAHKVNPMYDLVSRLYPAVAAFYGRKLFDRRVNAVSFLSGLLLLLLVAPLGRRMFIATAIASAALSFMLSPKLTKAHAIRFVLLGLVAVVGTTFFFNLRQATYTDSPELRGVRQPLTELFSSAVSMMFSEQDLAKEERNYQQRENQTVRPFFTLGFLVLCAQTYSETLGNYGFLSVSSVISVIPRAVFPNKDAFLEEFQEEERYLERDLGVPTHLDLSPSIPSSGLINAGMIGVPLQVMFIAVLLCICSAALATMRGSPMWVIGIAYLLVNLQMGEASSTENVLRLRTVVILLAAAMCLRIVFPKGAKQSVSMS
jgi:hypothetical protein